MRRHAQRVALLASLSVSPNSPTQNPALRLRSSSRRPRNDSAKGGAWSHDPRKAKGFSRKSQEWDRAQKSNLRPSRTSHLDKLGGELDQHSQAVALASKSTEAPSNKSTPQPSPEVVAEKASQFVTTFPVTVSRPLQSSMPTSSRVETPNDKQGQRNNAARVSLPDAVSSTNDDHVIFVTGDTGAGKSSAVPLALLPHLVTLEPSNADRSNDDGSTVQSPRRRTVWVAQPTRAACIGLAQHVSHLLGTTIGSTVGYAIANDSRFSADTKIIYATAGFIHRYFAANRDHGCRYLIIDEAHCRDPEAEALMAYARLVHLRQATRRTEEGGDSAKEEASNFNEEGKRLVVMSATLDQSHFQRLFPEAPTLELNAVSATTGHEEAAVTGLGRNESVSPLSENEGANDNSPERRTNSGRSKFQRRRFFIDDLSALSSSLPVPIPRKLLKQLHFRFEVKSRRIQSQGFEQRGVEALSEFVWHLAANGSVLVFLPGAATIQQVAEGLANMADSVETIEAANRNRQQRPEGSSDGGTVTYLTFGETRAELCLLHGTAFDDRPALAASVVSSYHGTRILLTTNLAEASLTVPGIKYAVDLGLERCEASATTSPIPKLVTRWINASSATQRAGRVGRTEDGDCIHLFPKAQLAKGPSETLMGTAPLTRTVLALAGNSLLRSCANTAVAPDQSQTSTDRRDEEREEDEERDPTVHQSGGENDGQQSSDEIKHTALRHLLSHTAHPPTSTEAEAVLEHLRAAGALTARDELSPTGSLLAALSLPLPAARLVATSLICGAALDGLLACMVLTPEGSFPLRLRTLREALETLPHAAAAFAEHSQGELGTVWMTRNLLLAWFKAGPTFRPKKTRISEAQSKLADDIGVPAQSFANAALTVTSNARRLRNALELTGEWGGVAGLIRQFEAAVSVPDDRQRSAMLDRLFLPSSSQRLFLAFALSPGASIARAISGMENPRRASSLNRTLQRIRANGFSAEEAVLFPITCERPPTNAQPLLSALTLAAKQNHRSRFGRSAMLTPGLFVASLKPTPPPPPSSKHDSVIKPMVDKSEGGESAGAVGGWNDPFLWALQYVGKVSRRTVIVTPTAPISPSSEALPTKSSSGAASLSLATATRVVPEGAVADFTSPFEAFTAGVNSATVPLPEAVGRSSGVVSSRDECSTIEAIEGEDDNSFPLPETEDGSQHRDGALDIGAVGSSGDDGGDSRLLTAEVPFITPVVIGCPLRTNALEWLGQMPIDSSTAEVDVSIHNILDALAAGTCGGDDAHATAGSSAKTDLAGRGSAKEATRRGSPQLHSILVSRCKRLIEAGATAQSIAMCFGTDGLRHRPIAYQFLAQSPMTGTHGDRGVVVTAAAEVLSDRPMEKPDEPGHRLQPSQASGDQSTTDGVMEPEGEVDDAADTIADTDRSSTAASTGTAICGNAMWGCVGEPSQARALALLISAIANGHDVKRLDSVPESLWKSSPEASDRDIVTSIDCSSAVEGNVTAIENEEVGHDAKLTKAVMLGTYGVFTFDPAGSTDVATAVDAAVEAGRWLRDHPTGVESAAESHVFLRHVFNVFKKQDSHSPPAVMESKEQTSRHHTPLFRWNDVLALNRDDNQAPAGVTVDAHLSVSDNGKEHQRSITNVTRSAGALLDIDPPAMDDFTSHEVSFDPDVAPEVAFDDSPHTRELPMVGDVDMTCSTCASSDHGTAPTSPSAASQHSLLQTDAALRFVLQVVGAQWKYRTARLGVIVDGVSLVLAGRPTSSLVGSPATWSGSCVDADVEAAGVMALVELAQSRGHGCVAAMLAGDFGAPLAAVRGPTAEPHFFVPEVVASA